VIDLLDDDGPLDLRRRGRRSDPADFVARERRGAALPEENAALQAWEDRPAPAQAEPVAAGTCAACGKPALATCRQCGHGMCVADSWTMLGLCRSCVPAAL